MTIVARLRGFARGLALGFVPVALVLAAPPLAAPVSADDLQVNVAGGTLKIKGFDGPDVLTIEAGMAANEFLLTPGAGTTVNGDASAQQPFLGVTGDIDMSLGAGDNQVTVDGSVNAVSIAGGLRIKTGNDNDTIQITGTSTQGGVQLAIGAGTNSVVVGVGVGNTFGGKFFVKAGKDNDTVTFSNSSVADNVQLILGAGDNNQLTMDADSLSDKLMIKGGAGVDTLQLTNTTATGNTKIDLGTGDNSPITLDQDDFSDRFSLKVGGGNDVVQLTNTDVGTNANIELGTGNNSLTMDMDRFGENLVVKSGKGDDNPVQLINTSQIPHDTEVGGNATFNLGAGNNNLLVDNAIIGENLRVKTGKGDDTIAVTNNTIGENVNVKAGGGTNTCSGAASC